MKHLPARNRPIVQYVESLGVNQGTKRTRSGDAVELHRAVDVLLVEDNPGDAKLTMEALRDAKIHSRVQIIETGEEALRVVRREPPYSDAPSPSLVLLDVNIPTMSGYEVLAAIKQDAELRKIPVIVITASENPADVDRAYSLGASVFLKKPQDLEQYFTMIRAIKDMWFRYALLPRI